MSLHPPTASFPPVSNISRLISNLANLPWRSSNCLSLPSWPLALAQTTTKMSSTTNKLIPVFTKDLTTEFCIDFTGGSGNGGYGYGGGSTVTVTKAPTTTTKTLSCGEASLSTVSSTTTKTFTTYANPFLVAY
jgi:hypothetical protein